MIDPGRLKPFRPEVREAIADVAEALRAFDVGTRAISLGGSVGKGTFDDDSDLDFRLFHERDLPLPDRAPGVWTPVRAKIAAWEARGVRIDGFWPRPIAAIDAALRRAVEGRIDVEPKVWSVWGYHLLTDIDNQFVLDDPDGVIGGWRTLLRPFPPRLKAALLEKHLGSLRYWRADYHYRSKVARGDAVFLASLAARLVHDLLQVLFALNERYFSGDGANLVFARSFAVKPADLEARVERVLYPAGPDRYRAQYDALAALIDDVETLAAA